MRHAAADEIKDGLEMNWVESIHTNRQEEQRYFSVARDDIMMINLRQLKFASVIAVVFMAFFIFITPFVFPEWHLTWPYYIFFGMMLLVMAVVYLYDGYGEKTYQKTIVLCVLFDVALMIGSIMIDVIPFPNFVSTYFQIGIVFIAALFTMPLNVTLPVLSGLEIAFIAAISLWKTPKMAAVDGYESAVGFICAILIALIVTDLRVKEGLSKYCYIKQGTTDTLTSVRNRAECEKLIRDYLSKRSESASSCALFMLDMDNFKQVNDGLGHQAGDIVLERVGAILKKEFRSEDVIGRIGGDEFIILVKDINDRNTVEKVSERVISSISRLSEMLDGVGVSCSLGAVIFDGVAEYESLYKMADDSMYEAKRNGGGKCVVQVLRGLS